MNKQLSKENTERWLDSAVLKTERNVFLVFLHHPGRNPLVMVSLYISLFKRNPDPSLRIILNVLLITIWSTM